jgi:hypothetical protein
MTYSPWGSALPCEQLDELRTSLGLIAGTEKELMTQKPTAIAEAAWLSRI